MSSQKLWAGVHLVKSPPDALHVEVVGQQFNWTLRYPGADGVFGRVSPSRLLRILTAHPGEDECPVAAVAIVAPDPGRLDQSATAVLH